MVAASDAIRGVNGIVFTLKLGAAALVAFDQDVKSVELDGEDADDSDITFAEAAAGLAQADSLAVTAIQSTKAASFWRYCWDNAGQVVTYVYGPHGNAVPTADKPHFTGTARLGKRPKVGGAATTEKTRYDFETSLEVLTGPTLVSA